MPDIGVREILAIASSQRFPAQLVLLMASESCNVQALAAAGARAIIPDDIDLNALVQSLRQIAGSNKPLPLSVDQIASGKEDGSPAKSATALTDRERQIMRLVSEGLSNKEIGRRLNLSDGTIKVHLHHIFQKLEVGNRTALAALANRGLWAANRPARVHQKTRCYRGSGRLPGRSRRWERQDLELECQEIPVKKSLRPSPREPHAPVPIC